MPCWLVLRRILLPERARWICWSFSRGSPSSDARQALCSRRRSTTCRPVDHITDTIVVGEVPPAEMMDLLTKTWGCGEHLAAVLLSLYGGHVMYASIAIRELAAADDRAAVEGCRALTSLISAPARSLSSRTFAAAGVPEGEHETVRVRVRKTLRQLAVEGFVPLDSETDKVAGVICLANAGFVVPRGATAASVPAKAWEALTPSGDIPLYVLVPSSHIMRQLIARKVFPAGTAASLCK